MVGKKPPIKVINMGECRQCKKGRLIIMKTASCFKPGCLVFYQVSE
jgi:hypothetical protein